MLELSLGRYGWYVGGVYGFCLIWPLKRLQSPQKGPPASMLHDAACFLYLRHRHA